MDRSRRLSRSKLALKISYSSKSSFEIDYRMSPVLKSFPSHEILVEGHVTHVALSEAWGRRLLIQIIVPVIQLLMWISQ